MMSKTRSAFLSLYAALTPALASAKCGNVDLCHDDAMRITSVKATLRNDDAMWITSVKATLRNDDAMWIASVEATLCHDLQCGSLRWRRRFPMTCNADRFSGGDASP